MLCEWTDEWVGRWVGGAILTKGHFPLFTSKAGSYIIFSANALFRPPLQLRNQRCFINHNSMDRLWSHLNGGAEAGKPQGKASTGSNQTMRGPPASSVVDQHQPRTVLGSWGPGDAHRGGRGNPSSPTHSISHSAHDLPLLLPPFPPLSDGHNTCHFSYTNRAN